MLKPKAQKRQKVLNSSTSYRCDGCHRVIKKSKWFDTHTCSACLKRGKDIPIEEIYRRAAEIRSEWDEKTELERRANDFHKRIDFQLQEVYIPKGEKAHASY